MSEVAMPWGSSALYLQAFAARSVGTGLWLKSNPPLQRVHAASMLKSSHDAICLMGASLTQLILKSMWHAALRESWPHVEAAICVCPQVRQDMLIQAAPIRVAGIHHNQHGRVSLQAHSSSL